MEKKRNSPEEQFLLFSTIFDISLTPGVKLHIHLLNVVVRFIFFPHFRNTDMSRYGNLEAFQIAPMEFEITRVDCIIIALD